MIRLLFYLSLCLAAVACDNTSAPLVDAPSPGRLIPLSPYQRTNSGSVHSAYFFTTSHGDWQDAGYRARLSKAVRKTVGDTPESFDIYLRYLYRKTDILNDTFRGDEDSLYGHYDDLISFVRWNHGNMDIFYSINKSLVVYDLLDDRAVDPWDFFD